jgi:hypothetical protein
MAITKKLRHQDYTVAWVCALPMEMAAAKAMLDEIHTKLSQPPTDPNTYTLGAICSHNVVIACLPFGVYGTTSATTVVSHMISFGIKIPDASAASTTNILNRGTGNLGNSATTCKSSYSSHQPTFTLVNFFNQGPAINTVGKLNNVTNPVGQTAVPNTNSKTGGNDSSSEGSSGLLELVANVKAGSAPSLGNWIWVGGDWGSLGNGGISL